jgi:hypothetical protein
VVVVGVGEGVRGPSHSGTNQFGTNRNIKIQHGHLFGKTILGQEGLDKVSSGEGGNPVN